MRKTPKKTRQGNGQAGLPINLERIFETAERNLVDKERPDDYKTRVCMD
jgi:hypothetical protein